MSNASELIEKILDTKILDISTYVVTVKNILTIIFILIVTKLVLLFIKKAIVRYADLTKDHKKNIHAIIQIVTYLVWTVSIVIILDYVGFKVNAILTGSAALLVGIGLGLQQTFNDFISGIILLFEGKTRVGDVLKVDEDVIVLSRIGLRTTEGVNGNGVRIILPNSKIVTSKVVNWTNADNNLRFSIDVGVAYGSDVEKVISLLEDCARKHPDVSQNNTIEARFMDFASSSLNFRLLFFSEGIFRSGRMLSDIRREINKTFNENSIEIPFQQVDVNLKNQSHDESNS